MLNILAIFKNDVLALQDERDRRDRRDRSHPRSAHVRLASSTLGFWDPYANTGSIKVAVANEDEGYSSALIPTKINAGDQVISALHENDSFDWVFVSEPGSGRWRSFGRILCSDRHP